MRFISYNKCQYILVNRRRGGRGDRRLTEKLIKMVTAGKEILEAAAAPPQPDIYWALNEA